MKETYFGENWECQCDHINHYYPVFTDPDYGRFEKLENHELGIVCVTRTAREKIQESDFYKIRALVFEYNLRETRQLMLVAREEEEPFKSILSGDKRAVRCIDDFLNDFPVPLAEKKQRALYLLYLQHKDYGDAFKIDQDYMLFAKNDQEREFILNSMVKQGLLCEKDISGDTFHYIADTGWEQLDPILKTVT